MYSGSDQPRPRLGPGDEPPRARRRRPRTGIEPFDPFVSVLRARMPRPEEVPDTRESYQRFLAKVRVEEERRARAPADAAPRPPEARESRPIRDPDRPAAAGA